MCVLVLYCVITTRVLATYSPSLQLYLVIREGQDCGNLHVGLEIIILMWQSELKF